MDKTNSKILTLSFALVSALVGFTLHMLIQIMAGAFGSVARAADSDLVRHGLPVVFALAMFAALQFNPRVHAWGEDVVAEIRKVVWPSGKDVTAMTIVVVMFVFIASVIITAFDLGSGQLLGLLMR